MKRVNRAVLSWCFYDWANSAFSLTVMAGFFPVFFKGYWCIGVDPAISTLRLGLGTTIAGIIIAIFSIILGAVADAGGTRKKFLGLFAIAGACATGMLFSVAQGDWRAAILIFIIANVGFSCANLFYDSLLIDVADKESMDFVSSLGYSLGYLGCAILFLVNAAMVVKPASFHLQSPAHAVRLSFLMASGWWIVFSFPLFLFVKERIYSRTKGLSRVMKASVVRFKSTLFAILRTPSMAFFVLAYWMYIDGLNTVMRMAVDFGLSLGFTAQAMMIALLAVQFVAFVFTFVSGVLAQRTGPLPMILFSICIYVLIAAFGLPFVHKPVHFIIIAGISGIAQGGIQALSRSYFGKLVPPSESAEYFGFFNVVGRFAVVGPTLVGLVALITHSAGVQAHMVSRLSMASVTVLFAAGGILLFIAERMRIKTVSV